MWKFDKKIVQKQSVKREAKNDTKQKKWSSTLELLSCNWSNSPARLFTSRRLSIISSSTVSLTRYDLGISASPSRSANTPSSSLRSCASLPVSKSREENLSMPVAVFRVAILVCFFASYKQNRARTSNITKQFRHQINFKYKFNKQINA